MNFKFSSLAVTSLTFGLISTLSSLSAQAANVVGVFGNSCDVCGFSLSTINNYYNSGLTVSGQPVSSSILTGTLDTNNLSNINLLWMVQPANSYTNAELNSLSTFLSGGGRIAFMGEHGTIAPNENNRISAAITALGGNISINNIVVDGGFRDATVGNGQILSNPLTAGVNTYNYAAFAPLNISGSAIALMNGTNSSDVMMAYQNIGAGSIFAITDQNVWDNVSSTGTNNNGILFQNLLGASTIPTDPTAVPEPFTVVGTFIGGTAALRMRKKLKSSTKV
ncbi:PEP-CTERM sorting domain-containing protein [Chamaesiphon sp. VAR_48_metabat_135_sub]|uniref:PEP-CTERM sorting domain-containing protein n=1 Tax=Chamaesiphon sp. VAR_48_metabat_135_sub TaxID=2964699 RepID=UPI00286BD9D1|nr:PEP-CTERM sorting domain-containing protein [Chamaesiphon sp. VAR_48_metabat_135_sub]